MAIIVNDRDVLLQSVNPRVQKVGLPSNVTVDPSNVPGLAAAFDATKEVSLSASSQLFVVPKVGSIQPVAITITALLKTITGTPTFTLTSGNLTFTNNGDNITISALSMTTTTATIEVSVLFNGVTYKDSITIGKVAEGSDAVVGLLSNEACTVAADTLGVVSGAALSAAGGTFSVFDGIINKTGDASVVYSAPLQNGCSINIAATGVYTVTSISANTASATLRAVYTRNGQSITIDKIYSVSKAIAGFVGSNAKLIYLTATSQVFQIPKTGGVTPTAITLTATAQNLDASATYLWTTTPTTTLGGTGNVRTLNFSDMATDTVKIDVTRDGVTDTISIVKVREGIDGINPIVGYLTNENETITTDSTGVGGVLNSAPLLGPELLSNGGFDVDLNWNKATGVTISGGKLVGTNVATGRLSSYSGNPISKGKEYVVTVVVDSITSGSVRVSLEDDLVTSGGISSPGTYTFKGHATATGTLYIIPNSAPASFVIDSISVEATGNLINNGDFRIDASGWTIPGTSSVTGGQITITSPSTDNRYLYQSIPTVIGQLYKVTWTRVGGTTNDSYCYINSVASGVANSGVGTFSRTFTATGTSTEVAILGGAGSSNAILDNISVMPVRAGQFKVYNGVNEVTTGVTYTVASETGTDLSIAADGSYYVNSLTADAGSATLRAVYNGVTLDKIYSIAKAKAGAAGSSKSVIATTDSQIFRINKLGVVDRTQVTVTATGQNLVGSPVFTVTGGATLTGSGNSRVLTYANMPVDSVSVTATWDGVVDTVTIVKVREGVDGINAVAGFLTNELAAVATDSLGNGGVFTGTGGTFKVFSGITDVTTGNGVAYVVVGTPTGISASIDPATGVYTLSNMSVDQTTVTFQATYGSVVIQKIYSITKAKAGAAGSSKAVTLSADSQIFKIDKAGVADRTQVTLSANGQNLVGSPAFTATGGATLTGTGNSRVLTFGNMPVDSVSVTVTWDSVSDTVTVVKVREGLNAVSGFLTNESALVAADKNGVVSGSVFASVSGTFKLYDGINDKTGAGNVSYSVFSETGVDISIAANGVYTVNSMSADTGNAVMRAVYTGVSPSVTVEKVFSIAKSRIGADGASITGARGTVNISRSISGTSWSDSEAALAISSSGYGVPQVRDIVTLYKTGTTYSESRFYSGVSWLTLDAYVNGNMLVSGTVSSAAIQTGAIQAKHLNIGSGGKNVVFNSYPSSTAGWGMQNNTNVGFSGPYYEPNNWFPVGLSGSIYITGPGTLSSGDAYIYNTNNGYFYPVQPGQRYEMSAYLSMHRCKAYVDIQFLTKDRAYITEVSGSIVESNIANQWPLNIFPRSVVFGTAPANAAFAYVVIRLLPAGYTGNGANDNPYMFASGIYFGEATANQTVPSTYSPAGGGTVIDGTSVRTNSLSADRIVAQSINTDRLVIGSVTANVRQELTSYFYAYRGESDTAGIGFNSTGGYVRATFNGCFTKVDDGALFLGSTQAVHVKHPAGWWQMGYQKNTSMQNGGNFLGFTVEILLERPVAGYYEFWLYNNTPCAQLALTGHWIIQEIKV